MSNLMIHRVEWFTPRQQQDTGGMEYFDPTNYADNGPLNLNIQPASAKEMQFFQARGEEVTHQIYANANPGIRRNDVLTFNGRRFVVMEQPQNLIERNRVWRFMALEWPDKPVRR